MCPIEDLGMKIDDMDAVCSIVAATARAGSASGLELGLYRAFTSSSPSACTEQAVQTPVRESSSMPPPKAIGENNVEDGERVRYQGQTRQAGQSHGSIVGLSWPYAGPEPWQRAAEVASISGREHERHAQKLNPCPPPAAPRSTR
jgi:hypothetical protein